MKKIIIAILLIVSSNTFSVVHAEETDVPVILTTDEIQTIENGATIPEELDPWVVSMDSSEDQMAQ